jgi:glucosamine-6-phosphate deaminase
MEVVRCFDYADMSKKAALCIAATIAENNAAGQMSLVSFPGGETPLGMVNEFVALVNRGDIDISRTRYVSLDEWVGLGAETSGTCAHFCRTNLLEKLKKPFLEYHIINGKAADIRAECSLLDDFIAKYGPLDVSALGIGLNGHIGFNEDGVDFNLNAHVSPLSETTKKVMGKYFEREYALEYGISQGMKQITAARKVVLIASGANKADILKKALEGPVSNAVPASILRQHKNYFVFADKAAAGLLVPR